MAIVTLCIVKKDNKVLLINRNKSPFMGMWNGLGGHKEINESAKECAIREIKEESNIIVNDVELTSISTWNYDDDEIYVYVANLEKDFDVSKYPLVIDEGIVDFKDIDWIINPRNYGIIPDLKIFIKDIKENKKVNYHLVYDNSNLIEVIKKDAS